MERMAILREKYRAVIEALLDQLGGKVRGKVKLAKLLYFVDFDHFERYEASVTGETYYRRPMGPLGAEMQNVIGELERAGRVTRTDEVDFEGAEPTMCLRLAGRPDLSSLTAEERETISRVARLYGNLPGTKLQAIAHEEAPFLGTAEGQPIGYHLAFYRGTFAE